jgi:hypothetical protein
MGNHPTEAFDHVAESTLYTTYAPFQPSQRTRKGSEGNGVGSFDKMVLPRNGSRPGLWRPKPCTSGTSYAYVCVCVYVYAHTNHGKQRRRRRAFQQPRWRRIEPWAGSKRTGGQDQHHSRAEKKGSKKGKESRRSMAPRHSERRSLSRSLFHAHPGCPITGESGNYAASD